jgi:hypothetical protein
MHRFHARTLKHRADVRQRCSGFNVGNGFALGIRGVGQRVFDQRSCDSHRAGSRVHDHPRNRAELCVEGFVLLDQGFSASRSNQLAWHQLVKGNRSPSAKASGICQHERAEDLRHARIVQRYAIS